MEKFMMLLIACSGLAVGQRNTYSGNPNSVVFPGPINLSNRQTHLQNSASTSLSQSLAVARLFNTADSFEDILNMVDGIPDQEKDILLNTRIGGLERTSSLKPVPAKCMPELQSVPFLGENNDHSALYIPACTRIKRCGGCCSHRSLVCEAVTSETRNFVVLVVRIDGNNQVSYKNKEIIPLEEHTSCQCRCRVKPEDCTERQRYVVEECRCRCINEEEERKCKESKHPKLWDAEACACLCRIIEVCNTGYEFDHNTCSCRSASTQRYFGINYNHGTKSKDVLPPVIVTLDASDPRRKHKDEPNY